MKIRIPEVTLELSPQHAVLLLGEGEIVSLSPNTSQEIYYKLMVDTLRRTLPSPGPASTNGAETVRGPLPLPPLLPSFSDSMPTNNKRDLVKEWWVARKERRLNTGECVYCDKPAQKEYLMCRKHLNIRRKAAKKKA